MKTLTRTLKLGLVLLASLSVSSATLSAQNLSQRGPLPFETFDVNKDGYISESELYDTRAARMAEKAKQQMPMRNAANAPEFKTLDANHDGKISKEEYTSGCMQKKMKP